MLSSAISWAVRAVKHPQAPCGIPGGRGPRFRRGERRELRFRSGITAVIVNELLGYGVDAITLGDHIWDQRGFDA
jgi:hypothetical protein